MTDKMNKPKTRRDAVSCTGGMFCAYSSLPKRSILFCPAALAVVSASCTYGVDITGRWQAILDLRTDKAFTAVDNQGMQVSGTYRAYGDGGVQFNIVHPDGSRKTVHG
jgi:hypothetical protein